MCSEAGKWVDICAGNHAVISSLNIWFISLIFRDQKLENVLVGSDGQCKLSDFGLSKVGVFHHHRASLSCGTPLYMASEVITILNFLMLSLKLEVLPCGHGVHWWVWGIMVFDVSGSLP